MTPFHPPWFDPTPPGRDDCVVPRILDRHAMAQPDTTLVRYESGETWSWAETREKAMQTAAALQARGVKPGDIVAAWAPNSPALVRAWFGANYAGAALAPINTSFRGRLLEHALAKTGATILIVHPELAPRLEGLSLGSITKIILTGPSNIAPDLDVTVEPHTALTADAANCAPAEVEPWDTPVIIFTSGTTGPSKAVVTSYVQEWTTARITYGYMTSADRILVNLPMFHVAGVSGIMAALASGGSFALFEAFDTRQFWNLVRETGSTTCSGFIGALTTFLHKEPAKPDDRDNPLRICTLSPISEETMILAERFGFDYVSGFNMTEVSVPLVSEVNETTMRSCGRVRAGVECRIVDAHDRELPNGEVGELVIRADQPWQLFKGYLGDAQATAEAWRNGWFHTGDLLWRDDEGRFYFVDRQKDAIRRRGENISSQEIEIEVAAYDDVCEVAAYGVDLPGGEQEVMICVAPKEGSTVDPRALIEFLIPRMAHFMVPRFVRIAVELPKTPTNKIQKVELRKEGVTAETWDREAAGIRLKREKLSAH
ncbi:AMP-binding protein [Phenylobacterium sp.]|uniref:AMP-binding protein n=1 Tax=Phenylobacterium sp. TaxID=1871053 RepID=UPI00286CAE4A|nr:AMP-binding protein [Phenylobacterium sp.]